MMNGCMIMPHYVLMNLLWLPLIVGSIRKKRDERRCEGATIRTDMHTKKKKTVAELQSMPKEKLKESYD